MSAILEISKLPNTLVLDPPLTDEEFEELSAANELIKLERDKEGKIIVNPPAGADSGDANSEIIYQLRAWWKKQKQGRVYDSNTGFFLPDGSSLSPDAAYVTAEQMRGVTKEDRKHFLRLTPAFVIELLSASDSHSQARKKMESWIANGSQLGWLIDPYDRSVLVYEVGGEPGRAARLEKADKVSGTGPVAGFVLDLRAVWSAYED
jgi:Uma2 family endonuclease